MVEQDWQWMNIVDYGWYMVDHDHDHHWPWLTMGMTMVDQIFNSECMMFYHEHGQHWQWVIKAEHGCTWPYLDISWLYKYASFHN